MFKDSSLPCRDTVDFLNDSVAIQRIAKASGFFKRAARKITPQCFVKAIMLAGSCGKVSFNAVARQAGMVTSKPSSRQNLARRCNANAVGFLRDLVSHVIQQRCAIAPEVASGFNRILIQDGSLIRFADSARKHFPAVSSTREDKAMLHLQFAYDYLTGQTLLAKTHPYSRTDAMATGDILEHLQPGDLCLRDLGYYKADSFQQIDAKGAFYVSRLKSEITVFHGPRKGDTLPLARFLRDSTADVVDQTVRLGQAGTFSTRLVAIRMPAQIAARRRRKLHDEAKRRNQTPSSLKLALCDWLLLITNLTAEKASAQTLRQLYRLRWHVELVFKTLKSNGCLRVLTGHASNPHHLEALLLGQLLQVILHLRLWRMLGPASTTHPLSLLKIAGFVTETLAALWLGSPDVNRWAYHLRSLLQYCRHGKRNRRSLENLLSSLR